jgi:hypothetical protein
MRSKLKGGNKMNKWFELVIIDTVSKMPMINHHHTIKYLSDKQTEAFKKCMKFSQDTKSTTEYTYTTKDYEVILQTSKNRNSLRIKNLKAIKIADLQGEINNLKAEIATETNKQWILEDMQELALLEAKLQSIL